MSRGRRRTRRTTESVGHAPNDRRALFAQCVLGLSSRLVLPVARDDDGGGLGQKRRELEVAGRRLAKASIAAGP